MSLVSKTAMLSTLLVVLLVAISIGTTAGTERDESKCKPVNKVLGPCKNIVQKDRLVRNVPKKCCEGLHTVLRHEAGLGPRETCECAKKYFEKTFGSKTFLEIAKPLEKACEIKYDLAAAYKAPCPKKG